MRIGIQNGLKLAWVINYVFFAKYIVAFFLFATFFVELCLSSCTKHLDRLDDIVVNEDFQVTDASSYLEWPPDSFKQRSYSGVEVALRRMEQMALLKWTPLGRNIPSRYGVYASNTTYSGLPYSLAIKTDSHIGTQVSLYTFMTALYNPFSVLYTEDLRKSPYHGFECAPYYGSTCSNSVMYALGIEAPFYTYMIPLIPGMLKCQKQTPDDIELCDILLKSGHVVMVYGIDRDGAGNIVQIKIFETTSENKKDTWIRDFSMDEFRNYWSSNNFVRYQYSYLKDNMNYEPCFFVPLNGEPSQQVNHPLSICTTKGDCVSFLEGDNVEISVLYSGYSTIELYRNGSYYLSKMLSIPNTIFKDLPFGDYKARLVTGEGQHSSDYTSFEVIDAKVSGLKNNSIKVYYSSSNATAQFLVLSDKEQNPSFYYLLSDIDRANGFYLIDKFSNERNSHFKVYFKGKYNIVASRLTQL